MFCFKKKSNNHVVNIDGDRIKIKSINDTYYFTFLLAMSFMYPTHRLSAKRVKLVGFIILSLIPAMVLIVNDMRLRYQRDDKLNLMRQSLIFDCLTFVIVKLISSLYRNSEMRIIIDEIDGDYEKFNNLPEDYRKMVAENIAKAKFLETAWIVIVKITAASFPFIAIACTLYSILYTDNPTRFMIHETILPFLEDENVRYDTPYYELFTVYSAYVVLVIFFGFTGFDGMFTVCTIHVSLRIQILCQNFKSLLNDTDEGEIKKKIAEYVKDHCDIIRLIGVIQKSFEVWLVGVILNAVVQIGLAINQITTKEGNGSGGEYYFFAVATIVHMFLPCSLSSDITYKAAEIANVVYCCPWETVGSKDIRRSMAFVIAKAQNPINLTAFNVLTFNMEMFVSILQTSYSMYTLLRN